MQGQGGLKALLPDPGGPGAQHTWLLHGCKCGCRDREALKHYFQILAALEHNTYMQSKQQRVLDMMVDMCVEVHIVVSNPIVASIE